jgi:hypothetical protein
MPLVLEVGVGIVTVIHFVPSKCAPGRSVDSKRGEHELLLQRRAKI